MLTYLPKTVACPIVQSPPYLVSSLFRASGRLNRPILCPFSGRRELARFGNDFGKPVGEPVEVATRSSVWQRPAEHLEHIADGSLLAPTPRAWATEAVRLYKSLSADKIVAERNFGGDMVREVIMTVDTLVSYRDVVASRVKQVRAEPIFALYEKGTIHHVGVFEKLEEEQCSYVPEITRKSPNRMDALVWALTELFPEGVRLAIWESL